MQPRPAAQRSRSFSVEPSQDRADETTSGTSTPQALATAGTPRGGASGDCDYDEPAAAVIEPAAAVIEPAATVIEPAAAVIEPAAAVAVIGPGAGLGRNRAVYAELAQDARFELNVQGKGGEPYDCYPPAWQNGCPAPNLESFAEALLAQGEVERSDCLVVGSRGGQVVLPLLWRELGEKAPPAVVINGGCAMNLPSRVAWPDSAVTFLLIGGKDYFGGRHSAEDYVSYTKSCVPGGNGTTAILFVREMEHMPQEALLRAVLPCMLQALLAWKARSEGGPPLAELNGVVAALLGDPRWSGRVLFTTGPGAWEELTFGSRSPCSTPPPQSRLRRSLTEGCDVDRPPAPLGLHGQTRGLSPGPLVSTGANARQSTPPSSIPRLPQRAMAISPTPVQTKRVWAAAGPSRASSVNPVDRRSRPPAPTQGVRLSWTFRAN
jgi:hypothetical protein